MKKLGFGMMRLPLADPEDQRSVAADQVCRMVDRFLERGFTYFDTAYMYHNYESERIVREALVRRHPRESFWLTDKLPLMQLGEKGPEDQERIFREQLEKCGVEYFDGYLLHNLNRRQYATAQRLDSFGFLRRLKEEGLARHIGFSFHDNAQLLDEILTAHPEVDLVQLQINYLDWDTESIQSRQCYETAARHGKRVVVMEPVTGGRLASLPAEAEALLRQSRPQWSPASWAIRFAASLDQVMVVLSGMSNLEQLEDNTGYMGDFRPLTEEERKVLEETVAAIRAATPIPCTGCFYCAEGCPQKIAIPEYFDLYNRESRVTGGGRRPQRDYYRNYAKDHGKASDCVACGQCEEACPQHIPVIHWLKEVAALFEP